MLYVYGLSRNVLETDQKKGQESMENFIYNIPTKIAFGTGQIRMLPVEDWQPNEGWGTVFITSIYENAKARFKTEPGSEVA